jgi:cytochrome c oxidase cbb3-type subunit 3
LRFLLCASFCVLACAAQADRDAHAVKNPLSDKSESIDAGKNQFTAACAACHGANGQGGRGPNLTQSARVPRMTDDQLFNTIRRGIPGGGMPAFPLPDNTIWQIVSFLRSLTTPAFLVPVTGDVHAGAEVYRRERCDSCHMIAGKGGYLGPDLTDVAASLTVKQLRDSIVRPGDRRVDGFRPVTVMLNNGDSITGVAKNYSNYSIDILDAKGALHLLEVSQVKDVQFVSKSLMPNTYEQRLSAADLQNLIAFLSRQTVRPDARPDQKVTAAEMH